MQTNSSRKQLLRSSNLGPLQFHFIASTGSFKLRQLRSLESVYRAHPTACITLHHHAEKSDQISLQALKHRIISSGYCFNLIEYSTRLVLDRLQRDAYISAEVVNTFRDSLTVHEAGSFWYSHETDLVRLFVLWEFGGFYLDTDVIVLRSMSHLHNVIGLQEQQYANGAVIQSMRRNPFIGWALNEFLKSYNGSDWGANGPTLLTNLALSIRMCPEFDTVRCDMHILGQEAFEVIHYTNMLSALQGGERKFNSSVYAFHYNNRLVGKWLDSSPTVPGTLAHQLMNSYCVFCDGTL